MEGMGEEKLYFLLLKSIKRPKGPLGQSVSANFVADCGFLLQVSLFLDKLFPRKMTVVAWIFSQSAFSEMISISLCVNYALSPMK